MHLHVLNAPADRTVSWTCKNSDICNILNRTLIDVWEIINLSSFYKLLSRKKRTNWKRRQIFRWYTSIRNTLKFDTWDCYSQEHREKRYSEFLNISGRFALNLVVLSYSYRLLYIILLGRGLNLIPIKLPPKYDHDYSTFGASDHFTVVTIERAFTLALTVCRTAPPSPISGLLLFKTTQCK